MSQPIYLDYAAATPLDESAAEAMRPYLSENFYNPSAVYQAARQVRHDLERARGSVADVLGCRDQEVYFTAGGTEANNLALRSVLAKFDKGHIVVSSIEHESILETAKQFPHTIVSVNKKGMIDLDQLEKAITEDTVIVSVMYANNEIGTIQPIREIADLIALKLQQRSSSLPLYLHSDACQAANYLDLQVSRLGVDMMTLNGGKIYGPKQSGALYIHRSVEVKPQLTGGGQESGFRSGTENVPASIAFATMLQKVQGDRKVETKRVKQIRDQLFAILSQNIKELKLNGDTKKRLPNNLNITLPGCDGERLLMELDESGLLVATGSACTASNDEPSHVLRAIGLSPSDAAASLRLTLGRNTSEDEIDEAAKIIVATIDKHQVI